MLAWRPVLVAGVVLIAVGNLSQSSNAHQGGDGEPVHVHDPLEFTPQGPGARLTGGAWRSYGRDLSNSRNAGRKGPTPREASRLVGAWSFRGTAGGYTGTPVVARGTVVVGSTDGTIHALDAESGALKWSRVVVSRPTAEQLFATPAVDRGRVYIPLSRFGRPAIVALRLSDGELLWDTTLDDQPGSDLYGSPVVWRLAESEGTGQRILYIGVSGGFGEHFDIEPRIRGSLVALDASDGTTLWKRYTVPQGYDGAPIWTTPAIDPRRGVLYAGTGNAYNPPAWETTDAILSFRARTGRITDGFQATRDDVYHHHRETSSRDLDFGASPNLFRSPSGRLLVGALQKSRIYWALDARTLKRVWSRQTGTTKGRYFQDTLASTAYDGRHIYGQNDDGQVWALTRAGRRAWVTRASGESNYSPLAVANGVVYTIRAAGFLDVRRASTGERLARHRLGAPAWGGVAVAGGWIFAVTGTTGTDAGYVVAYRPV
jgi:polyvinyl alcohol dehydrogenase (cytochrome)